MFGRQFASIIVVLSFFVAVIVVVVAIFFQNLFVYFVVGIFRVFFSHRIYEFMSQVT